MRITLFPTTAGGFEYIAFVSPYINILSSNVKLWIIMDTTVRYERIWQGLPRPPQCHPVPSTVSRLHKIIDYHGYPSKMKKDHTNMEKKVYPRGHVTVERSKCLRGWRIIRKDGWFGRVTKWMCTN